MPNYRLNSTLVLAIAGALGGCGGGGGGQGEAEPPPSTPPPTVTIDVADAAVVEGDAGTADIAFTVTLSAAASADVTVDYSTADGSASAGADYQPASGTLRITTGSTTATIVVPGIGDSEVENDETFTLTLSSPSANARLGRATATGTIQDDDVAIMPIDTGLNDTGIVDCSTELGDGLACGDPVAGTADYPRQDAEHGRDFTNDDDSDGRAGFAFVKLDSAGTPLADQGAGYGVAAWACVEDQVTGLVWEVRGAGTAGDRYTWLNTTGIDDGGDPGLADGGICTGPDCDTEGAARAANASALCGYQDWRLPRRGELLSIVDYGAPATPLIDGDWFPNAASGPHWTASVDADGDVRTVDFATGRSGTEDRSEPLAVRLVRGGDQ